MEATRLVGYIGGRLIEGPQFTDLEKENSEVLKGELFEAGLESDNDYFSDMEKELVNEFIEVSPVCIPTADPSN